MLPKKYDIYFCTPFSSEQNKEVFIFGDRKFPRKIDLILWECQDDKQETHQLPPQISKTPYAQVATVIERGFAINI